MPLREEKTASNVVFDHKGICPHMHALLDVHEHSESLCKFYTRISASSSSCTVTGMIHDDKISA